MSNSSKVIIFDPASFEFARASDFSCLRKYLLEYLFGLTALSAVFVFVNEPWRNDHPGVGGTLAGVAGFVATLLVINLTYLVVVDFVLDISLKQRQLRSNLWRFCYTVSKFNYLKIPVVLVIYAVVMSDDRMLFVKTEKYIYFICCFLFWWQWLVEAVLFSRVYGRSILIVFPIVIVARLISLVVMLFLTAVAQVEVVKFLSGWN